MLNFIALTLAIAVLDEPASHVAMNGPVSRIEFSPDGKFVAVGGAQGDVVVYDAQSWSKVHSHKHGSSRVTDIAFNPDGSLIAYSSQDKTIRIMERAGAVRGSLATDGWGMGVSFSPDGKRLAGIFADGLVRVWDVATAKEIFVGGPDRMKAIHVRWHPSKDQIAIVDASGWVSLLDSGTGAQLSQNKSHDGTPQFLRFSPDGSHLLVSHARGGNTPALALIETGSLKTVHNFESNMVDGAIVPGNGRIVGLGSDGELRIFDIGSKQRAYKGNPILKFRFFKPDRMALSPDGKTALMAGDLGTGFGFYVVPVDSLK